MPFVFKYVPVLLLRLLYSGVFGKEGTFLHITDIHLDVHYSRQGQVSHFCHADNTAEGTTGSLGRFGDYHCDSPRDLMSASIDGLKNISSKPDFILWTGDNTAHLKENEYNNTDVIANIAEITQLLKEKFPDVPVYGALGNHDYWPADQLPEHNNSVYSAVADLWKEWTPNVTDASFIRGGYYATALPGDKAVLLSLNTILYDHRDHEGVPAGTIDPAGQFAWLDAQLRRAAADGRAALIVGHMPPSAHVLGESVRTGWFRDDYERRFLAVVRAHAAVVRSLHFGHVHTDGFLVARAADGAPLCPVFVAPAVTPYSANPLRRNPGLRLVRYDADSLAVTDIRQFWLNLTAANADDAAVWRLEYSFADAYQLDGPIDAAALDRLIHRMRSNYSIFQAFFNRYNVQGDPIPGACDADCWRTALCKMEYLSNDKFRLCVGPGAASVSAWLIVLVVALALLGLALVASAVFVWNRKRHVNYSSMP